MKKLMLPSLKKKMAWIYKYLTNSSVIMCQICRDDKQQCENKNKEEKKEEEKIFGISKSETQWEEVWK